MRAATIAQDFDGKVVLITGGASGIGLECARHFIGRGARVMIADIAAEQGTAASTELGERATFCRLDVASESGWQAAIDELMRTWQRIDVLVNAAGIAINADIEHTSLAQFHRTHAVNVDGASFINGAEIPIDGGATAR